MTSATDDPFELLLNDEWDVEPGDDGEIPCPITPTAERALRDVRAAKVGERLSAGSVWQPRLASQVRVLCSQPRT
jgi:hypothetical protein